MEKCKCHAPAVWAPPYAATDGGDTRAAAVQDLAFVNTVDRNVRALTVRALTCAPTVARSPNVWTVAELRFASTAEFDNAVERVSEGGSGAPFCVLTCDIAPTVGTAASGVRMTDESTIALFALAEASAHIENKCQTARCVNAARRPRSVGIRVVFLVL